MNRPTSGVPDRGASGSARTIGTRSAVSTLAILLVSGLALRLIIAYVLLPGSGFRIDVDAFRFWAANLAANGPWGFYDRSFFHDYTPGYMYVLWLVGSVGQLVGGIGDLIKLPAILADVALAWLVHGLARELGARPRRALLAAAIVLVNPITWFDSSVWGQVDSVGTVFLLLGLREVWRDRPERAALYATIGAVIKPQIGILVPIVAFVVIRRAFFGQPADRDALDAGITPDEPLRDGEGGAGKGAADGASDGQSRGILTRLGRAERRTDNPVRILTTGAVGILTAAALSAPFGLSILDLFRQVGATAGGYAYLTVNAYNPWALITRGGAGLAATGAWLCDAIAVDPATNHPCPAGTETLIGPFWAVAVGGALLLGIMLVTCLVVAWRADRRSILVGVTVLAITFFVVPTRVHERYLFPFFALGAILAAVSVRWRVAYVILAVANFANIYVVPTTLYATPPSPGISDWLSIGGLIRSPQGVTVIALAHLAVLLWALAQLRPAARRRLARELVDATVEAPADAAFQRRPEPAHPPASVRPIGPALAHGGGAMSGALSSGALASGGSSPGTRDAGHRPSDRALVVPPVEWASEPAGVAGWLRQRLLGRPVRPDRSRALHGEPRGRFDRLDLWLMAVLVVSSLVLRTWRLSDPNQMHFDEVYHARTATEFLQKWRYGMDHDIYEWTHPHLAKYAMAAGIVLLGDDQVSTTSALGVPVRDAVIEPQWDDGLGRTRAGDRLYVATGSEVRVYDLVSRGLVATIAAADAVAVAVDTTGHTLYVGTSNGTIVSIDTTTELDSLRDGTSTAPDAGAPGGPTIQPTPFATGTGPISQLFALPDGSALAAASGDRVLTFDTATTERIGSATVAGLSGFGPGGSGDALVAHPATIPDPGAAAQVLASLLGGTAADYEKRLTATSESVTIDGRLTAAIRTRVDAAIADGRLTGLSIDARPRIAVSGRDGVTFVAPAGGAVTATVRLPAPAGGMALVTLDKPRLYVADGSSIAILALGDANAAPSVETTMPTPGSVSRVFWDQATLMVHALGRTADGTADTIYVIEPHANDVYADARLPFAPSAWALDVADKYPTADREQILAVAADGRTAAVDIGQNAFAWRVPGVLAGGLTIGLIYLLARILFRRRSIGLLAGVFVLADGMFFVQSRIAMNDVYVGLFIVAAYALFAALWTRMIRFRGAFWLLLPVIGLLLGLGLASKWVAAYSLGGLAILLLARSALGRVVIVGAMILLTTTLGYMAVSVPGGATSSGNLAFLMIMIGLTLVAAVAAVLHPIAWSMDEIRIAIGGPIVAGGLVFLALAALKGPQSSVALSGHSIPVAGLAFGLVLVGVVVWGVFALAGRAGFGPFAPTPSPDDPASILPPADPAPMGWLRPGWLFGLPIVWATLCLVVLPVVVYVISYIPWAMIDGNSLIAGWPPGHAGQTLLDLTGQMYNYHNGLRATHPASSPWWAWPLDLKPVWFYQGSFAGDTAASVYDAGNVVIWWMAIPAMAFAAFQAFRRRSLGLALITIGFACQWIAWARIDRATFQYHYYAALPFVVLALAYFVAELWHGASARTWLLARVSAALVIVGPMLLWLFKAPLCGYVRVEAVNAGSQACVGNPGELVITTQAAALGIVVVGAVLATVWQLLRFDRSGATPDDGETRGRLVRLGATVAAALVGFLVVGRLPASVASSVLISAPGFRAELLALIVLLPLGFVAWFVLTARDARRFVVGLIAGVVGWFVVLYPNIAALPLPSTLVNAYQGLLPTYLYPFQFPVNTDPVGTVPKFIDGPPLILLAALTLTVLIVGYSAWVWRLALAERAADERAGPGDYAPSGSPGSS